MRRLLAPVVLVAALAPVAWLSGDASQDVTGDTRLMAVATYVAFGFGGDSGFVSEAESGKTTGVSQEDKDALVRIRTQFEKWHRYVLINFPDQADLLVSVRVGRRGRVGGQVPVGGRPPGTGLQRTDAGASSPDEDMMTVHAVRGRARSMVWRRAIPNGLSGSPAPLFEEFRAAVEAASKQLRP